jgi:hypothetical protein
MRMTIQQGSIGGTTVYQETFAPTINAFGLVNLEIGSGTVVSGTFATIDWSAGPYFIETSVDVTGGTSYAVIGTSQLMSVPYALRANTAENVTNDAVNDADSDPNNEIELQPFGTEGQILTMVSGVPTWVTPSCGLSIGDFHAGGIIFYLDGTGCHGLVAAAADQSTGAEWGCHGTLIAGADGTAIGTGNQNTIDIEAGCPTPGTAADICANLVILVGDWFLPSKDELNLMYQNIGPGNALGLGNVGGFALVYYWSSTEISNNGGSNQDFGNNGYQANHPKSIPYYVRSVRAF